MASERGRQRGRERDELSHGAEQRRDLEDEKDERRAAAEEVHVEGVGLGRHQVLVDIKTSRFL